HDSAARFEQRPRSLSHAEIDDAPSSSHNPARSNPSTTSQIRAWSRTARLNSSARTSPSTATDKPSTAAHNPANSTTPTPAVAPVASAAPTAPVVSSPGVLVLGCPLGPPLHMPLSYTCSGMVNKEELGKLLKGVGCAPPSRAVGPIG